MRSLDKPARIKIGQDIEYLRLVNQDARSPKVAPIEGKLWELRSESDRNAYRMFYFLAPGKIVVLLHAFQKKTRKTPRHEIEIAKRRLERRLKRTGESR